MDDQPLPDPPCECEVRKSDLDYARDAILAERDAQWEAMRKAGMLDRYKQWLRPDNDDFFTQAPAAPEADWS